MELLSPEFGPDIRHCSPIEVYSVTPAGGGKRCFDMAFYHLAYAAGVRDKVYTLQTIKRTEHFLLASVVGTERLVLLMELTNDWLSKNFEHPLKVGRRDKKEPYRVPSEFSLNDIFGATEQKAFGNLHWNAEMMKSYGLPTIGFPAPHAAIKAAISGQLEIGFEELLYWLQRFTEIDTVQWRDYAPAMTRLAELITSEPAMAVVAIEGETFWLELGEVDLLRGDIVTIQRGEGLIGAFQKRENGALRFAAYQPLDAKAIRYATGLALKPSSDGTVCMRPDNWEYALDCSAGNGNFYAADSGACYLSRWEFGLGISSDGSRVMGWCTEREKSPQEPGFVATQIEVHRRFQDVMGE
jgi:hypothetical protein